MVRSCHIRLTPLHGQIRLFLLFFSSLPWAARLGRLPSQVLPDFDLGYEDSTAESMNNLLGKYPHVLCSPASRQWGPFAAFGKRLEASPVCPDAQWSCRTSADTSSNSVSVSVVPSSAIRSCQFNHDASLRKRTWNGWTGWKPVAFVSLNASTVRCAKAGIALLLLSRPKAMCKSARRTIARDGLLTLTAPA
jgi:hypothetical protein